MPSLRLVVLVLALGGCAAAGGDACMSWFSESPGQGADVLDPKLRAALDQQGPQPEFRWQPLAEVRANFDQAAAALPKLREALARVETRSLGAFRVRIYTPEARGPGPALLFIHGGG